VGLGLIEWREVISGEPVTWDTLALREWWAPCTADSAPSPATTPGRTYQYRAVVYALWKGQMQEAATSSSGWGYFEFQTPAVPETVSVDTLWLPGDTTTVPVIVPRPGQTWKWVP
jgi:hypothetical protein